MSNLNGRVTRLETSPATLDAAAAAWLETASPEEIANLTAVFAPYSSDEIRAMLDGRVPWPEDVITGLA
jgi:hypothetical protein